MIDILFRFALSIALGACTYMASAVGALFALRAKSELEPDIALKLGLHAAALMLGAGVTYLVLRKWAFQSQRPHRECVPRYLLVVLLGVASHEIAFYALLATVPWTYTSTLACTLLATLAFEFMLVKRWVFRA